MVTPKDDTSLGTLSDRIVNCDIKHLSHRNYGLLFEKVSNMNTAQQYWRHTFEIMLPEISYKPRSPGAVECKTDSFSYDKALCDDLAENITAVNSLHHEMLRVTENRTTQLNIILSPASNKITRKRTTRSLLHFIGDFSKSLFGIATSKDPIFCKIIFKQQLNKVSGKYSISS